LLTVFAATQYPGFGMAMDQKPIIVAGGAPYIVF
jgi:hypothetical protein